MLHRDPEPEPPEEHQVSGRNLELDPADEENRPGRPGRAGGGARTDMHSLDSPPAQVAEHSDQGRWCQEKPTSLSPLPVRWMGTLNL